LNRYIFDDTKTVRLQELGPRFNLKLRWLQKGVFNPKEEEFEFIRKSEMNVSRRKFAL
jgi:ribosome production factor 1